MHILFFKDQHNTASQELNEVATLIDGEVMKTVRVVGVTTTTAARRHDLMRKLHSPIGNVMLLLYEKGPVQKDQAILYNIKTKTRTRNGYVFDGLTI